MKSETVRLFQTLPHACGYFAERTAQNLVIAATTTVTAETGNNTSAANAFLSQTDGNLGATNVSKVPTASLLYAGSKTRIYAHFLPWFGGGTQCSTVSAHPASVASVSGRSRSVP